MVKHGKFSASVTIGGLAVPELGGLHSDCATYILMDLNCPGVSRQEKFTETDPFGESFEQLWPVTPYQVEVENRSATHAWASVYVDGKKAHMRLVDPGKSETISGFQENAERGVGAVREFLFSLPRRLRAGESAEVYVSPEERAAMSSVQIKFNEASYKGEEVINERGKGFDPVNKAAAKAAKVNEASRAGNVIGGGDLKPGAPQRLRVWASGGELAHFTFRYAGRPKLEELGLLKPEDDDDDDGNAAPAPPAPPLAPSAPNVAASAGAASAPKPEPSLGKRKASTAKENDIVDLS